MEDVDLNLDDMIAQGSIPISSASSSAYRQPLRLAFAKTLLPDRLSTTGLTDNQFDQRLGQATIFSAPHADLRPGSRTK